MLLWNAGTLVVILTGSALALSFVSKDRMLAEIDKELRNRADRALSGGPPEGRGRPEQGDGPPPRPRELDPNDHLPQIEDRQSFPFNNRTRPGYLRDSLALADFRRPRLFGLNGNSLLLGERETIFDPNAVRLALSGHRTMSTIKYSGQRLRVWTRPAVDDGKIIGAVQVARELDIVDLMEAAQLRTFMIFLPVGLLASAVAAGFLVKRTLRPVAQVTQAASSLSASDLSQRLHVTGEDEMAKLAVTFNQMLERLQFSFEDKEAAYAELERAYNLQRQFTADVSHELRTPLARVILATSSVSPQSTETELRSALQTADKAAHGMSKLVKQLLMLARADSGQLSPMTANLDVRATIADALSEMALSERPEIVLKVPEHPVLLNADPDHIARITFNLVENAVRHSNEEGKILIEVSDSPHEVKILVADTGEGISAENLNKIFDRFYRADAARSRETGGTGLGLAIVKSLVEANNGSIRVESELGTGTRFFVFFSKGRNQIASS